MIETRLTRRHALAGLAGAASLATVGGPAAAQAGDVVFLSTQLRPVEEAQKVRQLILRNSGVTTQYVTEEPPQLTVRMQAEGQAGRRTVSLVGALHGELAPLVPMNALDAIDDVARRLSERGIPANLMELGKLGGQQQRYIPWMQATYIMAAHRRALDHLPPGANVNALTYDQLLAWGRAIRDRSNGQRRIGLPAGPTGLLARFFQGYLYPSFTGGVVTTFRSSDAEQAWAYLKELWTVCNPSSTTYNFMQEPLMGGEVLVGFDHVARLIDALRTSPNDYVAFPAPAGPKGRGYMPVVAGLGIAANAPNRAGAVQLIDHLTRPETQLLTAAEVGFFPVVRAELPPTLPPGVRLAADAIGRTLNAPDAKVSLLPVGLGARGGEFNKVFVDTFQRIVLRNEPIRAVLDAEARNLQTVMDQAQAPCWSPDPASTGTCRVVM